MHISGRTITGDQIKVKPESEIGIPLADYIRQVVREEIAAHEERLSTKNWTINGDAVAEAVSRSIEISNRDRIPIIQL